MWLIEGFTIDVFRLQGEVIGIVKPGDSFCYLEEISNEAGVWVKISGESLQKLGCSGTHAYTLAYSNEKKQQYLVEKEVYTCMIIAKTLCEYLSLFSPHLR